MFYKIRVNGDFWYVSDGFYTQNGERASEFESVTAVLNAVKFLLNEHTKTGNLQGQRGIEISVLMA
jgi:hypothetical protein